jgi:branched-chain amino acid transport system substrate-binding protein
MRSRRWGANRAVALVGAVIAAVALTGCGSKTRDDDAISGKTLTIYSSGPMSGASRAAAQAVLSGEQIALEQARGRIGKYRIVVKPLDDSTPQRGQWDPGRTSENAHLATQDPTAIGYLGEFNSGASAVSIPLLNRLGIPQVSATNTAVGLTAGNAATAPGEPDKYYPTGVRTFVRIVPNDAVQAVAQVKLQKRQRCTKTYVLNDGEVDGQDSANSFTLAAQQAGLAVAGLQTFDPRATDYRALALSVAQTGADCVLISAITENNAVLLTKQIAAALPHATIFGDASMAESTYIDAADGGIPDGLDRRVMLTVPTLAPTLYPPAGRAFYADYERRYGSPQPYAIYGYEAMGLLLNAIAVATHGGTERARRSRVVAALFATRNRNSVIGTYSIDRNGDTTLRRYGVYRVRQGSLTFVSAIPA